MSVGWLILILVGLPILVLLLFIGVLSVYSAIAVGANVAADEADDWKRWYDRAEDKE